MIIAELQGKISSELAEKEDVLTSNVFSFFKYCDREFLKDYLNQIGKEKKIEVLLEEAKDAKFFFWKEYDDGTEPDLIVICGKYYLLFEAKLYSPFSKETTNKKSQIEREIKMGDEAAEKEKKEFVYVAITDGYYMDKEKYSEYGKRVKFIWTDWQSVTRFLESPERSFHSYGEYAKDLHDLLYKKNLRGYAGLRSIVNACEQIDMPERIFYHGY